MDQASYDKQTQTRAYVGELNAQTLADQMQRLLNDLSTLQTRVTKLEASLVQAQQQIDLHRLKSIPKTIGATA